MKRELLKSLTVIHKYMYIEDINSLTVMLYRNDHNWHLVALLKLKTHHAKLHTLAKQNFAMFRDNGLLFFLVFLFRSK